MKRSMLIVGLCAAVSLNVSATLLVHEGFAYGDVTIDHSVANPNAAGGTGLASAGWMRWGGDGASVLGSTSIAVPTGYGLANADGVLRVNAGSWALRSMSSGYSMNADTTYYFSLLIRNQDNSSSISDYTQVHFADGGTSKVSFGFHNNEELLISVGGIQATKSTSDFIKGNNVTVVGKLVLSSSGDDTLYASAFLDTDTISGEPAAWDLSVADELGTAELNALRIFVGGGNSAVDIDELRMGETFADVIPEPATLGLVGFVAMGALLIRRTMMI